VGYSGGGEEKNAEREGLAAAVLGTCVAPTGATQGRENAGSENHPFFLFIEYILFVHFFLPN
jgi:hypothetical protein